MSAFPPVARNGAIAAVRDAVAERSRGRVLLLSELFPPAVGGSAVLFQGIYSRISAAEVMVLTDDLDGAASTATGPDGVCIVRRALATSRWGVLDPRGLAHHLGVAIQVRRLMPRRDGIVHCARALPEGVAAMCARALGGPRYVCWAHGEDLMTALASRELTALTKTVYRMAAAAIANSRNTASILARLGVPDDKIEVIYPAVDAQRFHPRVDGTRVRARYAAGNEVLLLSVGRLQRRKGHDVAIKAVAALRHDVPQLRYVIAGDGGERAVLEGLAASLGVADRVTFAGVIPDDELPAYYAASDIFLLPNRIDDDGDIEGFGIVFLEAAASGKPVIAGETGGVPEAVERDVTGLLVDGADLDAVAAAIRQLTASPDRRAQMGLAGRARAVQSFSWQRATAAVSELQTRLSR